MEEKRIEYLTPMQQKAAMERDKRDYMRKCVDEQRSLSSNYFLGFWGALSGALFISIFWGMIAAGGWFSGWMGFVMAVMASKCYDAMKVKKGIGKIISLVCAVAISVVVGQVIADIIHIAADKEFSGNIGRIYAYYSSNFAEYLFVNKINLLIGYVCAAAGGWVVVKKMMDEENSLLEMEEILEKAEDEY